MVGGTSLDAVWSSRESRYGWAPLATFGVEVFTFGRALGVSQCPSHFRNYFIYNWESVLFCRKFCWPIDFQIWVFFFHLLLICITSYQIISLSSGNWLPGAHSYMTIVLSVAKSYHGHSQQNWAGLRAAHRDTAHWWPRNHLVITESEI